MALFNDRPTRGGKGEAVGCPSGGGGGLVPSLVRVNVSALFVGHDHLNDYYGRDAAGFLMGYGWALERAGLFLTKVAVWRGAAAAC
jgi:hypothetical protein